MVFSTIAFDFDLVWAFELKARLNPVLLGKQLLGIQRGDEQPDESEQVILAA